MVDPSLMVNIALLAGGELLRSLQSLKEIKRLQREKKEIEDKLNTGEVLTPTQEQGFQAMNMRLSELQNTVMENFQRARAIDESGTIGEEAEIASSVLAKNAYDVGKERQRAIEKAEGGLQAQLSATEHAEASLRGANQQARTRDLGTALGALGASFEEEKEHDRLKEITIAESNLAKARTYQETKAALKRMYPNYTDEQLDELNFFSGMENLPTG